MNGYKILLVEDSIEVYRLVSHALTGSLVELDWAESISKAQALLAAESYEIIILDIELPDGSGLDLCSKLQFDKPNVPIFILTSHDDLSEKVLGFSAGADDYITKPFAPLEFKARIESKLKKVGLLKKSLDVLKWREVEINVSKQEVEILDENKLLLVDLTALEFKLLTLFASKKGHVISRDKILNHIWGADVHIYSRSVDTHVSKLRKKLGSVSHIIESVHGAGYKFNPTEL